MKNKISRASLGRVPQYYSYIDKLSEDVETVSATTIARELSLGEVQVRKDLAALCGSGKPKIGYEVKTLKKKLKSYFDKDNGGTIIVGAGKLGIALLNFNGFEEYGLNVMAAFDHHPKKIFGYDNKNIYPLNKMKAYCKKHNIKMGIITVPAAVAQETFDKMYDCGIRLFLCFAHVHLKAPSDAIVKYENMALSLAHLKQNKIKL